MTASVEHVVAIGASAGGLEALQALVGGLAEDSGGAYVIAQHLAPDHPSKMVELLQRVTPLQVAAAEDGAVLEAGLILVLPPNCDAELEQDRLRLTEPRGHFGPSPSIDLLFDSLAAQWAERGAAVVLSGTGSDGARGLRAVGASGGLALVQSPDSARFAGMPLAAIAMGGTDLIADPATLGARLQDWFRLGGRGSGQSSGQGGDQGSGEGSGEGSGDLEAQLLAAAVAQLKLCTGIDFSQYKESTLRRQIRRRLGILGLSSIEDYLPVLRTEVSECQILMQNLLVTVTSFFRDSDAFTAFSSHLLALLQRRLPGEQFRVWIPGCATGEEVYSIAMVMSEAMGHPPHLCQELKIFATDLDEHSLRIARRGVYPASAVRSIPEALRQRYLAAGANGASVRAGANSNEIEISKDLRACVVFARHNICGDPPFPGVDVVSCRNLLIYFTPALQEQVIDLLALSLSPGGLLFLGRSESLSPKSGFRLLNPEHRIYERTVEPRARRPLARSLSTRRSVAPDRPMPLPAQTRVPIPNQHFQLLDALVRRFAKPSLVVDENHHLLEVIGDVSPYCRIPDGRITAEVSTFLRDELQAEARALFLLVRADRTPVRSCSLSLAHLSAPVWLEATPLPVGQQLFTLLSFNQEPVDHALPEAGLTTADRDVAFAREIERLERELLSSQDTLRRSMVDLEQANQELEASSEELQASAEELQSSNEELEASNEELQAANDELAALNQQLRARGDELEHLNTDMENIQMSLNQGMVIVDGQLRITRYSPLAVRVFGLVPSDVGLSLIGIPTTLPIPRLRESLLEVIKGQSRLNLEATSEDTAYLLQLMPYRNGEGQVLGGIITLTDVSEMVALRRAAEASLQEFTSLADALDQAVWKRDHTLKRFLYLSRRIEALTGWQVADLCADAQQFDDAIHPDDRGRVDLARRTGEVGWTVTYRLACPDGRIRSFCEVATTLDENNHHYVVGTLADVTDQELSKNRARLLSCAYETLRADSAFSLGLLDSACDVVLLSESFAGHLGCIPSTLEGQGVDRLAAYFFVSEPPSTAPDCATLRDLVLRVLHGHCARLDCRVEIKSTSPDSEPWRLGILPLGEGQEICGVLLSLTRDSSS
jgi:two-component system, chemotaxis family, CheB/CheR fusion protein